MRGGQASARSLADDLSGVFLAEGVAIRNDKLPLRQHLNGVLVLKFL